MNDTLTRNFAPDLEVLPRAKGGDGRTIVGIAVPYERPQSIPSEGIVEMFARGAFNHQLSEAHRVKVAREHLDLGGSLIGRVSLLRDDATGLYSEMRVSSTPAGEETLELIRDGALEDLSIGFRKRQDRRLSDGTLVRQTADLREIAVTIEGAYGREAGVLAVRQQQALSNIDRARQILAGLPVLPTGV